MERRLKFLYILLLVKLTILIEHIYNFITWLLEKDKLQIILEKKLNDIRELGFNARRHKNVILVEHDKMLSFNVELNKWTSYIKNPNYEDITSSSFNRDNPYWLIVGKFDPILVA